MKSTFFTPTSLLITEIFHRIEKNNTICERLNFNFGFGRIFLAFCFPSFSPSYLISKAHYFPFLPHNQLSNPPSWSGGGHHLLLSRRQEEEPRVLFPGVRVS